LATKLKLDVLFLCTDANAQEMETLKTLLNEKNLRLEQFVGEETKGLSDAAISIVDQWICANAKYLKI